MLPPTVVFLLLILTPFTQCSTIPATLISLFSVKAFLSDPSNTLHDWNTTNPATTTTYPTPPWCNWSGISCHPRTYHVIALDLSRRNLSGAIAPAIRLLTQLRHLNLSNNAFEGPLPPVIFRLPSLRTVDISRNNFNATFPPGFESLRSLVNFSAFSNSFSGPLPGRLPPLIEYLNLGGSYFTGGIPVSYGGCRTLRFLHLAGNVLSGPLPPYLGNLTELQHLEIGYNSYSGGLPREFGSMSSLTYLDISSANLSGTLPTEILNLTQLYTLLLFTNRLSGGIPPDIARLGSLSVLDLSDNRLSGEFPPGISLLKNLTFLNLMSNRLGGIIPEGVSDMPNLEALLLWNNSLTGRIPPSLGRNGRLVKLDVSSNLLTGQIPDTLCSGQKLYRLILFNNLLTGPIPDNLSNCSSLWRFRVEGNLLSGVIPYGFGSITNLTYVDLSQNNLSGRIPGDLSRAPRLQFLNVSRNRFDAELPDLFWEFPSLQIFSASYCILEGRIPAFLDGCRNLYKIELEGNRLSGVIPKDIGKCHKLVTLRLRQNSFSDRIPAELATLPAITEIDLSQNSLSGEIPELFANCSTLESFNVSYNGLSGMVPSSGQIFRQFHPSSFAGNPGLCGTAVLRPCPVPAEVPTETPSVQRRERKTAGPLVWILAVAFAIGIFALFVGGRVLHRSLVVYGIGRSYKREVKMGSWTMTAFQRLNFTVEAVVQCLNSGENIVGMGSAGTVFRASMPSGEVIAVKKLWAKPGKCRTAKSSVAGGGVLAEVEVLGKLRHRNIVRLLGCCSNDDTTLLLYEYMPNGNLDNWLHGNKDAATSSSPLDPVHDGVDGKKDDAGPAGDWATRYKIAMGVAEGIKYLHHDCQPMIVHRDLKPSNILLDADMEARVADFGVAKLLDESDGSMSVIAGSYGYIAPEYAYTLQVDEKSDIYSFGVILMETLTGRRSVNSEFGEGNSIVDWIRKKIRTKEGVLEVLDKKAGAECESVREEMLLVLRVALLCTAWSPADRPSMRDVVSMLQEAKPKRKVVSGSDVSVNSDGDGDGGGGGGGVERYSVK